MKLLAFPQKNGSQTTKLLTDWGNNICPEPMAYGTFRSTINLELKNLENGRNLANWNNWLMWIAQDKKQTPTESSKNERLNTDRISGLNWI